MKTNKDVHGAVTLAVGEGVDDALFLALYWIVSGAVNRAPSRAVSGAVNEAVREDPHHPSLQGFLADLRGGMKTNEAVNWTVYGIVSRDVYWAVDEVVYGDAAVYDAAVYEAVYWVVYWAVRYDPLHPSLQGFLTDLRGKTP